MFRHILLDPLTACGPVVEFRVSHKLVARSRVLREMLQHGQLVLEFVLLFDNSVSDF